MPNVDQAVQNLKSLFKKSQKEDAIVHRALEKRISRINAGNAAADLVVSNMFLAVTWPIHVVTLLDLQYSGDWSVAAYTLEICYICCSMSENPRASGRPFEE